jgi:hypothetical protein
LDKVASTLAFTFSGTKPLAASWVTAGLRKVLASSLRQ